MVVGFNVFKENYDYAILYFGLKEVVVNDGKPTVMPMIKLVKKMNSDHGPFFFNDKGKLLDVMNLVLGSSIVEINDEDAMRRIRKNYCGEGNA